MVTYRTSDSTRWGVGKGANLTATEIDTNFWDLLQRIIGVETNAPEPNNISNFTVVGTQMTIHMTDGTTRGPFTLPSAMIHYRGDWLAGATYSELDIFVAPNARGLYMTLRAHTAATTFDPNAKDANGNPLYRWLLPMTGTRLQDLSDVSTTAPTNGQYLKWDAGLATWLPATVSTALSSLTDVLIGTPEEGHLLTWDAASGVWVNRAASGGYEAQHRWRLVLRQTFAAGTWFNPVEMEFRPTAGVARSATDGKPFTDKTTTWWNPENAFDGNLTNYVSGDAPATGAFIGVGFPAYLNCVEFAIKVYNCTLNDFDIQHTTDGIKWETVAEIRGANVTAGTTASEWYTFPLTQKTGTFTPTIYGLTTAGAGTYSSQAGSFSRDGNRILFDLQLAWTAHSGAGGMRLAGLPFVAAVRQPVEIYLDGISLTTGSLPQCATNAGTRDILLSEYTPSGVVTDIPLDTAGSLYVSGHYRI